MTLAAAFVFTAQAALAQQIALGEKVPALKVSTWLDGQKPATAKELTYVEFFQSANPACVSSVKQLKALTDKYGDRLEVIVIAQENEEKVAPLLKPYLSQNVYVAMDAGGKIFSAFGVQYVPFGVLVDSKNRALWMGNSMQLTPAIIEKIK